MSIKLKWSGMALLLLGLAGIAPAAEKIFEPDFSGLKLPQGITLKAGTLTFDTRHRLEFKDPAIHPEAGSIRMEFQLNFDPSDGELLKKNRSWRNQTLFTIERHDTVFAQGYMTVNGGKTALCYGVFRKGGSPLYVSTGKFQLEKGRRYQIEFSFGSKILIHVDGKKIVTTPKPLRGLFGEAAPAAVTAFILGPGKTGGIANCCSVGNVKVLSRNSGSEKISIPKLPSPPQSLSLAQIRKTLEQQGAALGGFCRQDRLLDSVQPQIWIGYSEEGIYFAADIPTADGGAPRATESKHDGAVWRDDSLELRLQSEKNGPVYVFICNAAGTRLDGIQAPGKIKTADWSADPAWQVFTAAGTRSWQAAGWIPFKALNCQAMPPAGSLWKVNFSIGRPSGSGAALAQAGASCYSDPDGFPELFFTGTVQSFGTPRISDFIAGRPRIAFHVSNSRDPVVTVQTQLYDAGGRELDRWQFRLNDQVDAVYMPQELPDGAFTIVISGKNAGDQVLLKRVFSFRTELKSSLQVRNYPYNRYAGVKLTVNPQLLKKVSGHAELILARNNQEIARQQLKLPAGSASAAARFHTEGLSAGEYTVTARIFAGDQKRETISGKLQIFPRPCWFDNHLGMDSTVPEPWKPVEEIAQGNRVLLRDYIFNGRVMFQQIVNQRKNMLTKAPEFLLQLNNAAPADLSQLKAQTVRNRGDKVIRRGMVTVEKTEITLTGTLEFDGCTRYDLQIKPPPEGVTVKNLQLALHLDPGWGRMAVTGSGTNHSVETLSRSRNYPFRPYIFSGGDHGGIALFAESEENWTPDNLHCIRLVPGEKDHSMTVQPVAGKGIKLSRPFTYTFGLIATPVREGCQDPSFLTHWSRQRNGQVVFVENITYPPLPALPQGTLELQIRTCDAETSAGPVVNLEAGGKNIALRQDHDHWIFMSGSRELLRIPGRIPHDRWGKLVLSWDNSGYRAVFDGKELFSRVKAPIPEKSGSILTLGVKNYWQSKEKVSLQIDSLRLVDRGGSTVLLQDDYDENFTPDGFSTATAGGGMATAGARFVPAGNGKALELKTKPPVPEVQLRRQLGVRHERIWRWHNDGPGIERQWPPDYFKSILPSTAERVKKAHADGFLAIPYAIYPAIHYPSKLADQFGAEWETIPVNMMPYAPPAGHHMYRVSLAAKGYADYLLSGLADAFEKYHFDGIYTDGMLNVFANSNAAANCGWSDEKGNRHPTWPFFAVRENIKRIYRFVKSRPGRIVENHQSFSTPAMLVGFSDKIFTGELEDFSDLESARMRFSSRPWGGNLQLHRTEEWLPMNVMSALLVGSRLDGRALAGKHDLARKSMRLQKAEKEFGTSTAVFMPFYAAENRIVHDLPSKVRCAAWVKKGRLLLIVGNYSSQPVTAAIKINRTAAGLAADMQAGSALTGARYKVTDNTVFVPLLPRNFQIVSVRSK